MLKGIASNRVIQNTVGMSTRKLARFFNVSHATGGSESVRPGLQYKKHAKFPEYTGLKNRQFSNNRIIVMNDEKYFRFANF